MGDILWLGPLLSSATWCAGWLEGKLRGSGYGRLAVEEPEKGGGEFGGSWEFA